MLSTHQVLVLLLCTVCILPLLAESVPQAVSDAGGWLLREARPKPTNSFSGIMVLTSAMLTLLLWCDHAHIHTILLFQLP